MHMTQRQNTDRKRTGRVRTSGETWGLAACPVESDETIHALITEHRKSGCVASRDRVVSSYLRLVASLAYRYARPRVAVDDLMVEGSLCVLQAMSTFDPERGVPFGGYVAAILHRRLRAAASQLATGQTGMSGEIPEGLAGSSSGALGASEQLSQHMDERATPPEELAERSDDAARLQEAVKSLPAATAKLIARRFGLDGEDAQSIQELSAQTGLEAREVRRRLEAALSQLKLKVDPAEKNRAAA